MGDENDKVNKNVSDAATSMRSSKFKVTAEPALFLLFLGSTIQVGRSLCNK